MKNLIIYAGLLLILTVSAQAQGGNYRLEQSVIASGGGTSSDAGNNYTVGSTIGEPVAGTTSSGGAYSLKGGFRSAAAFAPTAAPISIGGQIMTMDGSGLRNARVVLIDTSGNRRTMLTGFRGIFQFTDLAAGETYIISVASRRYVFQSQVVIANENVENLVITANGINNGGLLQP